MEKLPDVFSKFFLKEGVLNAIDELAATAEPATSPKEKGKRASTRLKVRATQTN